MVQPWRKKQAAAGIRDRGKVVDRAHLLCRGVEQPVQHELAPAVIYLIENFTIATRRVGRAQHFEVDFVLDHAAQVAARVFKVDDERVVPVVPVQFAVRNAADDFVGPDLAELHAAGKGLDALDLQAREAGLGRQCEQD